MSDLQCAATFVFAVPGDDVQARALAAELRFRRVAAVYAGGDAGPQGTARTVAEVLGLQVSAEPELDSTGAHDALQGLADQHRGETVLVAMEATRLADVLPSMVRGLPGSDGSALSGGAVVEMRVDADGWVVDAWPQDSGSARRA